MNLTRAAFGLCLLVATTLPALAADRGDRVEQRLDRRGDRIEQHLDQHGDRIEDRNEARAHCLDRNGHSLAANRLEARAARVDAHLNRKGERINQHLDHKGERAERRIDRRHNGG